MALNPTYSVVMHKRVVDALGEPYGKFLVERFGTNMDAVERSQNNLSKKRLFWMTGIVGLGSAVIGAGLLMDLPKEFFEYAGGTIAATFAFYATRAAWTSDHVVRLADTKGGKLKDIALARQIFHDQEMRKRPRRKKTTGPKATWEPAAIPVKIQPK